MKLNKSQKSVVSRPAKATQVIKSEIQAFASAKAKADLKPFAYPIKAPGENEVLISITHCGICHSDLHMINNDWQMSAYPLVPGHEIGGAVEAIGSSVTHLRKGDRVGVGWQRQACLTCEQCIKGNENLCAESKATCVNHHGGFASAITVDSRFAFKIPEEISSASAAPLLCGGITVYSPMRRFGVQSTHRVGVIGIGGLGHLALQFARAFGCEVTAFSSSPNKEKEAKKLGAHHFVGKLTEKEMEKHAGTLDFIISTVNADLNWMDFIKALRPDGKLCFVGIPTENISIPVFALLGGRKSVCASPIGGRADIEEMMTFAARHKIEAMTECMDMKNVNEALTKLRSGKARYRMVLVNK